MNADALMGAQVELTAPDGRAFRFRVVSLVPYAGDTYAVLEHEGADGQLLVTHIETDADNTPVFMVAGEEDIISAVLEKQVAQTIARAMENAPETDAEDDVGCCGHDSCSCDHDHGHTDGCSCGHDFHDRRPLPSYIRRVTH